MCTDNMCHKKLCCRKEAVRDASCLSVVSFVASIVQYLKRSFFKLLVTSASDLLVHTILFCSVVFGVTSSLAVTHDLSWLCIVRERAWSLSRWRTIHGDGDYRAWRLVVEFPQYTTSDIIATTCEMVAVVHRRPCLQHLACCSVNSRQYRRRIAISAYPTCIRRPVRGVPVGISPSRLVWKN